MEFNRARLPVAVLAAMELVIFVSALLLATVLQYAGNVELTERNLVASLMRAPFFFGVMSIAMAATGVYNEHQTLPTRGLLARIFVATVGSTVVIAIIARTSPVFYIPDGVLLSAAILIIACSFLWHVMLDKIARDSTFQRRIIVYGAGRRAASLLKLPARREHRRPTIVGFIPGSHDEVSADLTDRLVEVRGSPHEFCKTHQISEIVVAMDDSRWGIQFNAFLECRLGGIAVTDLTAFLERETGKVRVDLAHPSWTLFARGFGRNFLQAHVERVFDLLASLLLLSVSWPLMLLTVLAIKLEDGIRAPVLYRQMRVGQRGELFALLKFRSMREDAEKDGKPQWAAANDNRVTRVGRIIRKLRIDELPQILNVLAGEMSLVGPRPERPEFVSQLDRKIPFYRERHTIKPGITGWAQLCYPYGADETDAEEKLQYDLFYVKNRNLLLYLAILLQTVEVVLWGKGAR